MVHRRKPPEVKGDLFRIRGFNSPKYHKFYLFQSIAQYTISTCFSIVHAITLFLSDRTTLSFSCHMLLCLNNKLLEIRSISGMISGTIKIQVN